jgi:hypothetical protein
VPRPTIVGKEAIRAYWEAIVAKHVEVTREITGVEGNTVITLSRYMDDDVRSLGLEFTEGKDATWRRINTALR